MRIIPPFAYVMQPMQYIPTITNYTQLWWVPNVVVAHQKEGIEAVHLASGRTLCKVKWMYSVLLYCVFNSFWQCLESFNN